MHEHFSSLDLDLSGRANKIDFAFSTLFCDFLCILQKSAEINKYHKNTKPKPFANLFVTRRNPTQT